MRCFVAVDLSPAVRAAMAAAQRDLREAAGHADVRWVEPAAFHLTLKFLGEVAAERRAALEQALAGATAGHGALGLVAHGLGGFPSARRPRVVWAGVGGQVEEVRALAAAVEEALGGLGFSPEARGFNAHVTLGRVRSPRGLGELARALATSEARGFGTWTVNEIVLYRSHLGPRGAVHEPLVRVTLTSP